MVEVGSAMIPLNGVACAKSFDEKNIEHDGTVMLIDFWATWCPPCQKPMKHNDEMIEKHPEWAGNVRIIGVSIDQDANAVMPHVEKHGYGRVEHYVKAASTCADDYAVRGVPHVVLVGRDGKVVYVGHPAATDLESQIAGLI